MQANDGEMCVRGLGQPTETETGHNNRLVLPTMKGIEEDEQEF